MNSTQGSARRPAIPAMHSFNFSSRPPRVRRSLPLPTRSRCRVARPPWNPHRCGNRDCTRCPLAPLSFQHACCLFSVFAAAAALCRRHVAPAAGWPVCLARTGQGVTSRSRHRDHSVRAERAPFAAIFHMLPNHVGAALPQQGGVEGEAAHSAGQQRRPHEGLLTYF